jgi:MBG domain (YGX type)
VVRSQYNCYKSTRRNHGCRLTGGVYNYGNGIAASATDRAIGFLSGTSSPYLAVEASPLSIYAQYSNASGKTIHALNVSFNVEKYKNGANGNSTYKFYFYYSLDGINWNIVNSGCHAYTPDINDNAVNPAASTNKSFSITNLSIPNGSRFYFRWTYNGTGSSGGNAQGIALDDVSVTAINLNPVFNVYSNVTKTYGDAPFSTVAISNSSGTITYSSSNTNVAIVNSTSGLVTINGAGSTIITANQAAVAGSYFAGSISATLTVNKAYIAITPINIDKTYGETLYSLNATTGFTHTPLKYNDTLGINPTVTLTMFGQYSGAFATDSATNYFGLPPPLGGPPIVEVVTPAVYYSPYPSNLIAGANAVFNPNNYGIYYQVGTITVHKAILQITAVNKTAELGATAPPFTVSYNGFVNGESAVNLISFDQTIIPTASCTANTSQLGNFPITASAGVCDNYEYSFANGIFSVTQPPLPVVNLKLFVQDYYDVTTNAMRPVMSNQGASSDLNNVEVITVELYNATSPYNRAASTTAILKTDGTVQASFNTSLTGSYYIAVKGKAFLQTWTANPKQIVTTPLTYDFSSNMSQAYGNNMRMISNGVWGFYTGDINQDEVIDNSDLTDLFRDIGLSAYGVLSTDINGDGVVDNSDTDNFFLNIENSIYSMHPY